MAKQWSDLGITNQSHARDLMKLNLRVKAFDFYATAHEWRQMSRYLYCRERRHKKPQIRKKKILKILAIMKRFIHFVFGLNDYINLPPKARGVHLTCK